MTFKEKDIRDLEVLKRYCELVEKDSAKMLASGNTMERIDQKKWGLGESVVEFEKSGFTYEKCIESDTLFVNPRPKFDVLMEFYAASESSVFWAHKFFLPKIEARREKIFRPRAEYVNDKFKNLTEMRIGDIGAGFGLFIQELQNLHKSILDIEAIEPSDDLAAFCIEKGIIVNKNMLENLVGVTKEYDLLTCFELFEHLHDPMVFLKDCYKMLNPGGHLLITTLNGHGFDIQVLWEKSNSIFPPHHLNFFNPVSMKNILKIAGFDHIEISTPGELDIDIVHNVYKNGNKDLPRFMNSIFNYTSEKVLNNFQQFIKENCLSSHMRVVARKPY
jgi:SAM-dependent methyltransferase